MHIILVEDFADADKPVIFNALDIFVLASQSESFGVVFLEAWACKKPVIATNMGAIASLLSNGKDSFLFNAGDIADLISKINQLTAEKSLRDSFGENGYAKTTQKFSLPVIVKKYRDAYLLGIDNFNREFK